MSQGLQLLTDKQLTVFEQQLQDNTSGLLVRVIQSPSGLSRLKYLRSVLYSSVHPIGSKRKIWINRLLYESKRKKKVKTIHGIKMCNVPLLESSSGYDSDEKQYELDGVSSEFNVAMSNKRYRFPAMTAGMSFPVITGDFDDINPLLIVWGDSVKKISGQMALRDIMYIQKGKVTPIAQLSHYPSSHVLSIVTKPVKAFTLTRNETLDIEAPTELDRDKFALAFSTYLCVPIQEDPMGIV
jgi:hypothetical protein